MLHFFTRDWKKNNKEQFPSVEIGNDILIYFKSHKLDFVYKLKFI